MIAAIIQARMNSTRLPQKVLKEVVGKPLLELLIERLRCCRYLDDIIIATTVGPVDDPIQKMADRLDVKSMRGSDEDVLGRFYEAAKMFNVDHIVRITADCPLIDPVIVDQLIEAYMDFEQGVARYDYLSNTLIPTFPDGLDVEVFSFKVLEKLHHLSTHQYQREHVCTYLVEHPEEFRIKNVVYHENLSELRWTLDNPEDYELINAIYEALYPVKKIFLFEDILKFLEMDPHLKLINKNFKRNEGFIQSLESQGLSAGEKARIIDNVIHKKRIHEVR